MEISVCQADPAIAKDQAKGENRSVLEYQFLAQVPDDPSIHIYGRTPEEAVGRLVWHFAPHFGLKIKT